VFKRSRIGGRAGQAGKEWEMKIYVFASETLNLAHWS